MSNAGETGHYLTLYYPCDNKKISVIPLPIRMPNGEIIASNHMELLSKPDITIEARKADLFPGLSKTLLLIGTFCELLMPSII